MKDTDKETVLRKTLMLAMAERARDEQAFVSLAVSGEHLGAYADLYGVTQETQELFGSYKERLKGGDYQVPDNRRIAKLLNSAAGGLEEYAKTAGWPKEERAAYGDGGELLAAIDHVVTVACVATRIGFVDYKQAALLEADLITRMTAIAPLVPELADTASEIMAQGAFTILPLDSGDWARLNSDERGCFGGWLRPLLAPSETMNRIHKVMREYAKTEGPQ